MIKKEVPGRPLRVFISGQKYFGGEVYRICRALGFEVVGVCCPPGDGYIGKNAAQWGTPIIPAGGLNGDTFPEGVDLGITAHSWDYVGKRTRYKARLGWIGYHPSLLPRHRGRSSIEWALKMGDYLTGGTVFWLNSGIDRGDIERQAVAWVDPALRALPVKQAAARLWRDQLLPLGLQLLEQALRDIAAGQLNRTPQDERFATFEPALSVPPLARPDLLMLPEPAAQA